MPPIFESRLVENPNSTALPTGALPDPAWFHQRLPGYAPTPLRELNDLAAELGLGRLLVKDESSRLGLPAFKIMGASWATYRALADHLAIEDGDWETLADLRAILATHLPLKLATATDGNHGRALARMANLLGLECQIYVPAETVPSRIEAIAGEGATVTVIDGIYDQAVKVAASQAGPNTLVISDTSWEGYEEVPGWVIEGYATIFREIEAQGLRQPDLAVLPLGVGALGAAVIRFYGVKERPPSFLGVEPIEAACVEAALVAGGVISLDGPTHTIMAGLNCQTASPIAFPTLAAGLDATIAISDAWAEEAMRVLGRHGVVAGESGGACLAGVLALLADYPAKREALRLGPEDTVLIFVTEGATDPDGYRRVVG